VPQIKFLQIPAGTSIACAAEPPHSDSGAAFYFISSVIAIRFTMSGSISVPIRCQNVRYNVEEYQ